MSILVFCPGCRKRYRVNEKFAGKTAPCPNCKHPITVPAPAGELKVHVPEPFEQGGRSTTDQLVLKPVSRVEVVFNPLMAAAVAGIAVMVLAMAWTGGKSGLFKDQPFAMAAGLILLSPLLSWAAYSFLYDDELEPYKGKSLLIRAAICGWMYAILWGVFGSVSGQLLTGEVWNWVFIAPAFCTAGAMIGSSILDLEFGNGFFHYSFYLLITIVLRWIAGMGWIWNVDRL
jgi:hypothetical protein